VDKQHRIVIKCCVATSICHIAHICKEWEATEKFNSRKM